MRFCDCRALLASSARSEKDFARICARASSLMRQRVKQDERRTRPMHQNHQRILSALPCESFGGDYQHSGRSARNAVELCERLNSQPPRAPGFRFRPPKSMRRCSRALAGWPLRSSRTAFIRITLVFRSADFKAKYHPLAKMSGKLSVTRAFQAISALSGRARATIGQSSGCPRLRGMKQPAASNNFAIANA